MVNRIVQKGIHYVWYNTLLICVTAPRYLGNQHLLSERHRNLTLFAIYHIKLIHLIIPEFTKPPSPSCTRILDHLRGWYCVVTGGCIRIVISFYRCNDIIYYSKRHLLQLVKRAQPYAYTQLVRKEALSLDSFSTWYVVKPTT